jgi:hypothetical protein
MDVWTAPNFKPAAARAALNAHVFNPENNLDFRPTLLGSSGLVKSNGTAAIRRANLKPAILRPRQRL